MEIKHFIETMTNPVSSEKDKKSMLRQAILTPVGSFSDGYHTFDELYEHRVALNAGLFNLVQIFGDINVPQFGRVWKSKFHADGTMFDNFFIVGLTTPEGLNATYHYHLKWLNLFKVEEIPLAPEWDGHTPADVVERLMKLFCSEKEA